MGKVISFLSCFFFLCVFVTTVQAERPYFLGTQNGMLRTNEVFMQGYYKDTNLFLVIGAKRTTRILNTIRGWKSSTTYSEDIETGTAFFSDQINKAGASLPQNFESLGEDMSHWVLDPFRALEDISLITPISILFRISVNTLKIAWDGILIVGEPVLRIGSGVIAFVGAPFLKPVSYIGIASLLTVTSVYGYGSSAVGGAAMLGLTGAVLALDVVTSPFVLAYNLTQS